METFSPDQHDGMKDGEFKRLTISSRAPRFSCSQKTEDLDLWTESQIRHGSEKPTATQSQPAIRAKMGNTGGKMHPGKLK